MIGKLYLTFVPAIGVSIFLLLLIASESLAARPSYYTGGIALPYISDTWRDAPNYYLGLVGGIICGACLLVQHAYLNVRIAFACGDRRASILWLTASALGALSGNGSWPVDHQPQEAGPQDRPHHMVANWRIGGSVFCSLWVLSAVCASFFSVRELLLCARASSLCRELLLYSRASSLYA